MSSNLKIPANASLRDFLSSELEGSTLTLRKISETELFAEYSDFIQTRIVIDHHEKKVRFELYSPRWKRHVTVEELGGFDFLESKAQEELKNEGREIIAVDMMLALDLLRSWARERSYEPVEVRFEAVKSENSNP